MPTAFLQPKALLLGLLLAGAGGAAYLYATTTPEEEASNYIRGPPTFRVAVVHPGGLVQDSTVTYTPVGRFANPAAFATTMLPLAMVWDEETTHTGCRGNLAITLEGPPGYGGDLAAGTSVAFIQVTKPGGAPSAAKVTFWVSENNGPWTAYGWVNIASDGRTTYALYAAPGTRVYAEASDLDGELNGLLCSAQSPIRTAISTPTPSPPPPPATAPSPYTPPTQGFVSIFASLAGSILAQNLSSHIRVEAEFTLTTNGGASVTTQRAFGTLGREGGQLPALGASFLHIPAGTLAGDVEIRGVLVLNATTDAGGDVRVTWVAEHVRTPNGAGQSMALARPATLISEWPDETGEQRVVQQQRAPRFLVAG